MTEAAEAVIHSTLCLELLRICPWLAVLFFFFFKRKTDSAGRLCPVMDILLDLMRERKINETMSSQIKI